MTKKKILITGANGFIGKNLYHSLKASSTTKVYKFLREDSLEEISSHLKNIDILIHLAGENRPKNTEDFEINNSELTRRLCKELSKTEKDVPVIMTSSTQAENNSLYGKSKLNAENHLKAYCKEFNRSATIIRLPGVFGKWCKPNYNSVIATFCHNIVNNIPIEIHERKEKIDLVYIDDVVSTIKNLIESKPDLEHALSYLKIKPQYSVDLNEVSALINSFKESRSSLVTEAVGYGFTRALYSTYLSYLPVDKFTYPINSNIDKRGAFVEMIKTKNSGQVSYFTAHPGVTRGGHYHHTKTEKFLVVKGKASFAFKNILTNEKFLIETDETKPVIVETIPGWAHDITNVGKSEMIVLLWANEIFDEDNPDTISYEI